MPAVHYDLTSYLYHTPDHLLRSYFRRRGLLANLNLDGLRRRAAARMVTAAIAELPAPDRAIVESDFREMFFIAKRAGTSALCDLVGVRGLAAEADHLANMENDFARTMQLFLDHSEDPLFGELLHYAQGRTIGLGRLHRRSGLPSVEPRTDADALDALADGLRHHFLKQRRGARFEILHSPRMNPERHWFIAFGEDHRQADMEFTEEGLTCQDRRPAFEVAYVWCPSEGLLEVSAPGDRRDCDQLIDVFRSAILPTVTTRGNSRPIAIHPVLDPAFAYATDPKDGILRIEPVKFRFTEGHRSGAAVDVQRGLGENLHTFVNRVVNVDALKTSGLSLYSATMRTSWRPEAKRGKTTTFTLTMPDATNLTDDPRHQVIRGYLRRWGLAA